MRFHFLLDSPPAIQD
uniref:Uncharacterized protein n=1 Tax=Rhizophora mucronata TaxID=61149 RepID=A0A2P2JME1_RHIMU